MQLHLNAGGLEDGGWVWIFPSPYSALLPGPSLWTEEGPGGEGRGPPQISLPVPALTRVRPLRQLKSARWRREGSGRRRIPWRWGAGQREGQAERAEGGTCGTSSFPGAATPSCQRARASLKGSLLRRENLESKFTDVKRIYFLFCNLGRSLGCLRLNKTRYRDQKTVFQGVQAVCTH